MIDQKYRDERANLALMWGCNFIQFTVLLLIQAKDGQIEYDDPDYHALTGQPGQTLRAMVERGWLYGPDRKEKPRARPWSISPAGRRLLHNIKIGLRPPDKLSPTQYQALLRCDRGQPSGVRVGTLTTLVRWGYIYGAGAGPGQAGRLTPLGQEAYQELLIWEARNEEAANRAGS
ncbi:MAG: hypothetical protein L6R45_10150 [Anaerolineae bacterium]|nr:hypothetical protein [Anaerolineae bacterium]